MVIAKITQPLGGTSLIMKINEIIDALNTYNTNTPLVSDVAVNDTTMTLTYTNGATQTRGLQDTTYGLATTEADGLMSKEQVASLDDLKTKVDELAGKV